MASPRLRGCRYFHRGEGCQRKGFGCPGSRRPPARPASAPLTFHLRLQDLLDSDWASVRKVLEQADILVIKYSVTDKLTFQQVRNGYAPRLRPLLRHWGVPVILVAVGARLNGEDPSSIPAAWLCFLRTRSSRAPPPPIPVAASHVWDFEQPEQRACSCWQTLAQKVKGHLDLKPSSFIGV